MAVEHPHIKSFARRAGRVTPGQQAALKTLWDQYVLDPNKSLSTETVFEQDAPLTVEIGFGDGESLAQMAQASPDRNFIGIEVHKPGVGHLMLKLKEHNIRNVRIYCGDAIEIIEAVIPDQSIDTINLFFADPWPKKRHHKRRIVRNSFIDLIVKKLKEDGKFHAATDWEDYAEQMMEVLTADERVENCAGNGTFIKRPESRPETKFERRGIRLGHSIRDLLFRRV
ncbi:MAG: tRNA (guanosine(46)-N7)-methyltransferase TrmB [Gammaproteobacteria bacterium]|nr:MAG: tRNA (guanosine(46)-N7)-methyltransferase TrmB [Gammaproteobacteria bacterium]RLA24579.1 MAG: tRNA (guanosine(46)-N7)-methyltransferase TrmB [Gammaproteobacteria bacterium]